VTSDPRDHDFVTQIFEHRTHPEFAKCKIVTCLRIRPMVSALDHMGSKPRKRGQFSSHRWHFVLSRKGSWPSILKKDRPLISKVVSRFRASRRWKSKGVKTPKMRNPEISHQISMGSQPTVTWGK
jgi:hypothetical protein